MFRFILSSRNSSAFVRLPDCGFQLTNAQLEIKDLRRGNVIELRKPEFDVLNFTGRHSQMDSVLIQSRYVQSPLSITNISEAS